MGIETDPEETTYLQKSSNLVRPPLKALSVDGQSRSRAKARGVGESTIVLKLESVCL